MHIQPFVDDTVIFAGRVREAKRARKQELDQLLAGKSARFGEGLRMSAADDDGARRQLRRERDRLAGESADDWVRLVLYEDWSHGYLQMCSLMTEATDVVNDLADWMAEAFVAAAARVRARSPPAAGLAHRVASPRRAPVPTPNASASETDETDGEAPIAFVSRRIGTPRSSFSSSNTRRPNLRQGSDDALAGRSSPPGSDGTLVELDAADAAKAGRLAPPLTPRGVSELKTGTPGSATPTLTETELMKRRRLLDAHIFE
jgi:hypothetical protein